MSDKEEVSHFEWSEQHQAYLKGMQSKIPDGQVTRGMQTVVGVHTIPETPQTMPRLGVKHDQGKPMMGLLDSSWLIGVAQVLTFGAKKYAAHNWRNGLAISKIYDATQRHLNALNDGEDIDPESGLHHALHASCEMMFLYWMLLNRKDLDDRWLPAQKSE